MKRYVISVVASLKKYDEVERGGATVKAPADIEQIVVQKGYERVEICLSGPDILQYLSLSWQLLYWAFRLERKSCLLFQYPMINPKLLILLLPFYKKFYLQLLIHDINSLRVKGYLSWIEKSVLSFFDALIVHSIQMENVLGRFLHNKKYRVLNYFPYCAEPETIRRYYGYGVCFAGNLSKSTSLIEYLGNSNCIMLFLYAKKEDNLVLNEKIIYKGTFNPNLIQGIEGNWGLIWDGNAEDADCWRNYTRINAPHKFSLYVMAHMPVIVWEESAIAQVVKEREIGFTIGSLQEIENKIMQVTPEQYNNYVDNIIRFSEEVESGENVLEAIR